jgi:hypothetical protein
MRRFFMQMLLPVQSSRLCYGIMQVDVQLHKLTQMLFASLEETYAFPPGSLEWSWLVYTAVAARV